MRDRPPFDKNKRGPAGRPGDGKKPFASKPGGKPGSKPPRKTDGRPARDGKPAGKTGDAKFSRDKRPPRDGGFSGAPAGRPQRDGPKRDAPPRGDRPYNDRPRTDRPRDDKPRSDRPRNDRPRDDRPRNDAPRSDRPYAARPAGDRPYKGRPGGDKRRDDTSFKDRPRRDRPPVAASAGPIQTAAEPKAPGLALTASLWGVHAVTAAWLNPARNIFAFAATETALIEFQETLAKGRELGLKRPTPSIVERQALDKLMPAGTVHQGLVLDAAPLQEVFVQDLAVRATGKARAVILILDQVTDPHNIGAILRSASAFGAVGVVMQSRNSPELNGVMAKAASGALESMPVAYETNLSRAVNFLQAEGFTAIGLDERGAQPLADLAPPAKTVLLLGAEGKGLRHNLREHCDALVSLPTTGPVLSLNVSNAAAVALYALNSGKTGS